MHSRAPDATRPAFAAPASSALGAGPAGLALVLTACALYASGAREAAPWPWAPGLVAALWLCAAMAGLRRGAAAPVGPPSGVSPRPAAFAFALAAASVLLYLPGVRNPFHDDDPMFVLQAREFVGGVRPFEWYFWHRGEQYFRPMVHLWWLIGYRLFGQAPEGYHLMIAVAHGLAGAGVAALERLRSGRTARALLAGAIFVAWPLNTGAPAILCSGFDNAFSTALGLWSVAAFLWFRLADRRAGLALAAALWALALLNKEAAVAFPLLALLLDLAIHGGPRGVVANGRWRLRDHAPAYLAFVAVFAVYVPLRTTLLGGFTGGGGDGLLAAMLKPESLARALLDQGPRYLFFPLNDSFWPADSRFVWLAAALWGVLLARAAFRGGVSPVTAAIAVLWAVLCLAPVYGVFWISSNLVGERFLYLPTIGLAWLLAEALEGPGFGRTGSALAAAFLALLVWTNWGNNRVRVEESPTEERFLTQFKTLLPEMPSEARHWFLAPPTGARGVRFFVYPSLLKAAIAVRYPVEMHERFEVAFLSNFGSPEEAEHTGLDVTALEIGTKDFFWRWDPREARLASYGDAVRARLAARGEDVAWTFEGFLAPWELREGRGTPGEGGVRLEPADSGALLELPPSPEDRTRAVRVVVDADRGPERWTWTWECDPRAGDCFPGERRFAEGAGALDLTNDLAWRMTTAPVRLKLRGEGGPFRLRGIRLEGAR